MATRLFEGAGNPRFHPRLLSARCRRGNQPGSFEFLAPTKAEGESHCGFDQGPI